MNDTLPRTDSARGLALLFSALVAVVAIVLYWPALDGQFVYDDLTLVEVAPASQSIGAAFAHFFEPLFAFANQSGAFADGEETAQRGIWRPLTSLWFAFGRALGGEDPFGYHAVSLLTHIAATIALIRLVVLVLLTRKGLGAPSAEFLAAAVGLLFAVHPASVEAVAWISAVNDPLWALFGFSALLAYERAAARERVAVLGPALVVAALLAKESALVLPVLVLLLDWSAGRIRGASGLARRAAVLAVPLLVWFAARIYAFGALDGGLLRRHGDFALTFGREVTLRIELLGGFIANALWPSDPEVFRPVQPVLPEGSGVLTAAGLWIAGFIAVAAWLAFRGRRTAAAALVGFVVVLAPFIAAPDRAGLFPLSDRYLYGALGPLAIGVAVLGARFAEGRPLALAAVALAVPAGLVARSEIPQYANTLAFQAQAVLDAPKSPAVRWAAGNAYFREYLRTEDVTWLERSYLEHMVSLRLGRIYGDEAEVENPNLPLAERVRRAASSLNEANPGALPVDPTVLWTDDDRYQATLGQIRAELSRVELTEERDYGIVLARIDQALRFWSGVAGFSDREDLRDLRIRALQKRGDVAGAKAELAEGMTRRGTGTADDYRRLAELQAAEGDFIGARGTLERALLMKPDDRTLLLQHSIAALETKQLEQAVRSIERAQEVTGNQDKQVIVQRSVVDLSRGRANDALRWVDRALEIDAGYGEAFKQRAMVRTVMNDVDRAINDWQDAARALPDDFVSHYNLAALLLQQEPAEDADQATKDAWRELFVPIVIRAYTLAPPRGAEQLFLQDQIERFYGQDVRAALGLAQTLKRQDRAYLSLHWLRRAADLAGQLSREDQLQIMPRVLTEVGDSYVRLDRPDEARAALTDALSLDPEHFPARLSLGLLLFEKGEDAEARTQLERALELLPSAQVPREMVDAVRATLVERLGILEQRREKDPAARDGE